MTKYGTSPWVDEFPKSRMPAYPRQRGPLNADAVVIGGGLTGCATAYAFAAAGLRVVLLEADRVGRGATAHASGWIAEEPGVPFADLERAVGLRAARGAFHAWRRAALDFAKLLRRLDVRCHLDAHPALTTAAGPEQAARLKRDQKARRGAGLDAVLLNARVVRAETALDVDAALRTKGGFTLDPYRACVGLASAAAARGAQIFERTAVHKTKFGRRTADVFTAGGTIRTGRIVVATAMPTALFRSLARHFWFHTTFFAATERLSAKIRQSLGRREAVVRDSAVPPHVVRWIDDRLLVSGADGERVPERLREKIVVQRTGQLMYELSTLYPDISGVQPAYGWSADYARTAEGIPYIGAHRNYPHHLFAFGGASRSVTGAYLASRIFLRAHLGEPDPADDAFGFNR